MLLGLLRQVHEPRQPPLARQHVHRVEKALQPLERLRALESHQPVAPASAGLPPPGGDRSDRVRHVLRLPNGEPGLLKQTLVVAERRKEEEADGTARAHLLVRQLSRHHDRIGEQGYDKRSQGLVETTMYFARNG